VLASLFDHNKFNEPVARFAAEGGGVVYVLKLRHESEGDETPYESLHAVEQVRQLQALL
jgi:hypothetical protein